MSKVQTIVVVGGGTSGWLTASYLQTLCTNERQFKIILVESPDVGIIGVGESTLPTLKNTLQHLGVDELDFMRKTNATFKQGIKFVNWLDTPTEGQTNYYYHPFSRPQNINGIDAGHCWLSLNKDSSVRYAEGISIQPHLCENLRSPKLPQDRPYVSNLQYSYHLDSALFGSYLRDKSIVKGVERIGEHISDVTLSEEGSIEFLQLASGRRISGDLFIDCTGFKSMLMSKLEEPFISFKEELLCDRAVAIRLPNEPLDAFKPYTTSTAMDSGWIWDVPLSNRRGVGYVYSSAFVSDEQAETTLRKHIGYRAEGVNAVKLNMRVGKHRNMWVKNCVAIGLSGGFIEPLEATGIYLIELGAKLLAEYFPIGGVTPILRDKYNALMNSVYQDTMEFIVLHYCTTNREDTSFWKAVKYDAKVPDRLMANLELWKRKPPSIPDMGLNSMVFNHENHLYVLAGMNYLRGVPTMSASSVPADIIRNTFSDVQRMTSSALNNYPDHATHIAKLNRI